MVWSAAVLGGGPGCTVSSRIRLTPRASTELGWLELAAASCVPPSTGRPPFVRPSPAGLSSGRSAARSGSATDTGCTADCALGVLPQGPAAVGRAGATESVLREGTVPIVPGTCGGGGSGPCTTGSSAACARPLSCCVWTLCPDIASACGTSSAELATGHAGPSASATLADSASFEVASPLAASGLGDARGGSSGPYTTASGATPLPFGGSSGPNTTASGGSWSGARPLERLTPFGFGERLACACVPLPLGSGARGASWNSETRL
mmetsp:Transcript_88021/g.235464  ORF Transcript_88021/g.235464 Transcript_88021/m.235464 type:complete len:265 (+) Transcript_88021:95-889(+)